MSTNPRSSSSLSAANLRSEVSQSTSIQYLTPKSIETKSEVDLKEIWQIVQRRRWLIAGVACAVFTVTTAWSLSRKPVYMSTFRLLIEPTKTDDSAARQAVAPNLPGSGVNYTTLTQVLRSSETLLPIYQSLQRQYPTLTFDQMLQGLNLVRLKDTEIIEVSYLDQNSAKGQLVAEKLAEGYLNYGVQLRNRSVQQGIDFVEKQLPGLTNRVDQIQGKLERFRKDYEIVNPEDRAKYLTELIGQVESEQQQLQAKLAESKTLYGTLQQQVGQSPQAAIASSALSESKSYQALRDQLQQIETQISINSERLTPESPPVQALIKRRDGMLKQIAQEEVRTLGRPKAASDRGNLTGSLVDLNRQLITVSNEIKAMEARNQSLLQAAQQLRGSFAVIPTIVRQNTDLQRELLLANNSLDRFLASRETLQIEAAQKNKPWQIIAAPMQRPAPVFPSIPQSAGLGFIGSLFLGVMAALLAEKLDDVLYSAEELKQDSKFPILSIVPFYKHVGTMRLPAQVAYPTSGVGGLPPAVDVKAAPAPFLDLSDDAAIFREAFRSLYLSLSMRETIDSLHSVVVTSPLASDGKSTVALNLALAAATMGRRVLLVDADLYRPRAHIYSHLTNNQGLSQVLTTDVAVQGLIQQSLMERNLFVLTAGERQSDASRLLSSPKMLQIMDSVKSDYDLIIYDTPPLLGFSDSLILSSHTDGSLVVVGLGNTGRAALVESFNHLQMSGNRILGVVANCLKPGMSSVYKYHEYVRQNYNASKASEVVEA